MFERILYPTDFSDASLKAVDYLKRLKDAGARHVTVLHVIDQLSLLPPDPGLFGTVGAVPWYEEIQREATDECRQIVSLLTDLGLEATFRVEVGKPAEEILKWAKAENASLIVIGSHSKSHVAEIFLGSVSEAVIRKADRPVLVIKPNKGLGRPSS